MEIDERAQRIALLEVVWYGIGRDPSDKMLRALAIQTARIPLPWFAEAVNEIGGIWEPGPRVPTARTFFDAARRIAGFRPLYTPEGYIDPTPSTLQWWPPVGYRVTDELSQRWGDAPERIDLPGLIPARVASRGRELEVLGDVVLRALPEGPGS